MRIGNLYILNHQISDLNGEQILKNISLQKLKKEIDILIIDDDEFPLMEDLRKHEFNIEHRKDINSLKDVEPYFIILCDIHGIGKFLGSQNEGAYLAHQIKEEYPSKFVISYTADTTSPSSQKYLNSSDNIISKGTSIEDWASLLSDAIKEIANPVKIWKKIELRMLEEEIPTKEIANLEDKYVKAMKTGQYTSLEKLVKKNNTGVSELLIDTFSLLINIFTKK